EWHFLLFTNSLAVNITGSVGSNISVSCSYPETYQNNSKHFCQTSGSFAPGDLQCVHTTQPESRSEGARLALLDDTSAHVLTANISRLAPEDSGKYWCGVDIALLPDYTSQIWITVTSGEIHNRTNRDTLTFIMQQLIHAFPSSSVCVLSHQEDISSSCCKSVIDVITFTSIATLIVTLITITNVLIDMKASSLQDEYVKMHSVVLTNSPTARSDRGSVIQDFHRPANIEPVPSTDACYIDFVQPDLDQIYTEMNPDVVQECHPHQQPIKITVSSHFSCNSFSVTLYNKVPFANIS
uniref:Immunoglobulin V-set domain-containing protein n=1 Tax=Sinocyclocheilus rhinocerous TaxID=307959 RepID=A0A673MKT9_9TELE